MSIWDRVCEELHGSLYFEIDRLRATPEFIGMGSDIERALAAFCVMANRLSGVKLASELTERYLAGSPFVLIPQYEIGPYRVDFLFSATGYGLAQSVVVECDGHAFHEKTKEQAARDKSRDRYLSERVAAVLRFTGSEIYRSPEVCWGEITKVFLAKNAKDFAPEDEGQ